MAFAGRVDMLCPFWFSIGVKEKETQDATFSQHSADKLSSAYHQQICIGAADVFEKMMLWTLLAGLG